MGDTLEVEVGQKGRVVIPATVRTALGIGPGTRLAVVVEDGAILLVRREDLRRRLRAMFAGVDTSLSEELLSERRAEASAEA